MIYEATLYYAPVTVSGQTPRQSMPYVLASTIANVTSMLVDQVATFVY